jgi:oligoendopeptidase F
LAKRVQSGDEEAVERYLTFLGTGSSAYPLDALREAGVDMTSPEPIDKAFEVLADYVDRLEILIEDQE